MGVTDFSLIPSGSRVTVDTAPIIYLLEGHAQFHKEYLPLFERIDAGDIYGVISVIALAEVLAGPLKHGNEILADCYFRALASSANWRVQGMDSELSFIAARIRVRYNLKLPDAIQVATAIQSRSIALVTHDRDFSSVDEIQVLGAGL